MSAFPAYWITAGDKEFWSPLERGESRLSRAILNISAECLKAASAEKLEFAAQQHELAKDELECASVVLAKIGDGFEVRRQPAQQPKDF
jgi:hypothetical protein